MLPQLFWLEEGKSCGPNPSLLCQWGSGRKAAVACTGLHISGFVLTPGLPFLSCSVGLLIPGAAVKAYPSLSCGIGQPQLQVPHHSSFSVDFGGVLALLLIFPRGIRAACVAVPLK